MHAPPASLLSRAAAILAAVALVGCAGGAARGGSRVGGASAPGAGASGASSSGRSGPGGRIATAARAPDDAAQARALAGKPRRASLRYEVRGRPFPLPLVTGTIGGQPATMMIDTGANSHIVASWFAKKAGLAAKKADAGTDHVGKSIPTYRIDKPDITIDEWGALAEGPVLATDVPEVFERLGIAAFLSPQRMVTERESIVLDLARAEMRGAVWDEAHYELSAEGVPMVQGDDWGRTCEETIGAIKVLSFVLPATVGTQRVSLLVDTGAQHSDVFMSSPAGQRLVAQSVQNQEPLYTASGKISARKLKGVKVTAGSFAVTTDVDLIGGAADASCPRDGVLAMDLLRSCALLFGPARVYGRCTPPAPPEAPGAPGATSPPAPPAPTTPANR